MVPAQRAPDALVHAGGVSFAAHARLLAAHSGYFKTLLGGTPAPEVLHLPGISAQQFWPLLAYMYTGHLQLSADSVYQVLLAAHALQVPRALELCRAWLAAPPAPLRPVASRGAPRPGPAPARPRGAGPLARRGTPFRPVRLAVPPPPDSDDSQRSLDVTGPGPSAPPVAPDPPAPPVLDVACCDGPVRFQRVLNGGFRAEAEQGAGPAAEADSDDSYVEVEEGAPYDNCNAFSKSLQRQMSENIRLAGAGAEPAFACAYCSHTFKSQYCYQKHARRHLNPVSMDAEPERPAREPRVLDMNVQYYPCKTCGCKFPSYYFVHKHRKLCHAAELAGEPRARRAARGPRARPAQ